ncbi:hypothetical protein U14_05015 [Candidatus Moduliflexus flocculans]|uniref:AAA+ ATPase domain-containing protein n=1 Tax=Candidatus Moduliflexus flocculans TaxID=1499966 RepID=A0A081BQR0_9BACT|nr:hypothetical protein U14_05015 [Candidatus Moduliflexus flocculans]
MPRFFNTAGPVNAQDHYCLPPLHRFDLDDILRLIEQKKYFVLHAPRQTGKTSSLLALQAHLNASDQYRCLYCNVEVAQSAREHVERGIKAILGEMADRARTALDDDFLMREHVSLLQFGADKALNFALTRWAEASPLPLIVLMDKIDSLVGDTLIAVLRQLRAGYDQRPAHFPQSVLLCGVRDVRDYRLRTDEGKAVITGGSAFNIKAESLRLGNFSRDDLTALYHQHTEETGQIFEETAIETAWQLTQGQPWLVNALAYETCFRLPTGRDRSQSVTAAMMQEAKERLIARRETHLDQLSDKLKEPRVHGVIAPILAGDTAPEKLLEDDVQYVYDLGLITIQGQLRIANPIYQEVIPRVLTYTTQLTISQEPAWYLAADGRLDMEKLLAAFQQFFREHSEHWVERFEYKEAGPQLLLQAFLQRIINGGGRIEREYGLGRRRTDLLIIWPHGDQTQRVVMELKLQYGTLEQTLQDGLEQTWQYMDRCGTADGHLIIFNRQSDLAWDAKIFHRAAQFDGHPIAIWGM